MKSNLKILKHRDFDFEKVRFYAVKFEEDDKNQLDQFFSKYENKYSESVYYIQKWLAEIGEKRGATSRYFRTTDNYDYLPPSAKEIKLFDGEIENSKMLLRLYCIVLSEEVVLLVNGGVKESQNTQKSPTCWIQAMFTSNLATQIAKQFDQGNCELIGKRLKMNKNFSLTYAKK